MEQDSIATDILHVKAFRRAREYCGAIYMQNDTFNSPRALFEVALMDFVR